MKAEEALAVAKTYVNQTLVGMGALRGAPCTIKSMTKVGRLTTTVFEWTDTSGASHENTMLVYDGLDGTNGRDGTDGADGFSPTITVKSSTSSEYILTITDKEGSYDTPNLKGSGGGGGGASALTDLTDVQLASLASGDALVFNGSKWANVSLATVATSGSYNDLSDKPTIPAAQVNSDWDAVSGVAQILNKPSLATVATSGDYDDLTNKPTIPTKTSQLTNDGADGTGGSALGGVCHDEQLHERIVHVEAVARAHGLHDEHVGTTHAVDIAGVNLAVSELLELHVAQREAQFLGDTVCQRRIHRPRKHRHGFLHLSHVPSLYSVLLCA